uniref:inositol-polyphosphate 5-phosphatase n=1 Tax=Anopheles albimanus TaxID=7167 RepID=A0A182FK27_ANOAL
MATTDQESSIPVLLVTANVGSVFEDPSNLLHLWVREFLDHVSQCRPKFIALHLQEVGGKTYEKSMDYVQEFIANLCESEELSDYSRIRVYLDEDYNSAEHFTALGNLYFVQSTVKHVLMWNFLTHEWDLVEGKSIYTGSIETVASKEKAKFPQQFFPECKWSRKGFLRTRWFLNGTVFDLVNIHLFHDASNLAACEEFPSVYCKSRRRALVYTLERFHKDTVNHPVPYFVFGDFNFRCDTEGVIKKLTEDLTMHRIQNTASKPDSTKVQYRDSDGVNVLTVGKKEFSHCDQSTFKEQWLRQFDRELDSLRSVLYEYPITFPPSYPYEEDPLQPGAYMTTRCPAWCDRILISPAARKLICGGVDNAMAKHDAGVTNYGVIGSNVCMGDHKQILEQSGTEASDKHYCQFLDQPDVVKSEMGARGEKEPQHPAVSINVYDTDSNLNVCMCALYCSNVVAGAAAKHISELSSDDTICPNCRNIIKHQPVEHRKRLISRRMMLANDIIVNRIDTHYLNTFVSSSNSSGFGSQGPSNNAMVSDTLHYGNMEPYTPESAESHSPLPETNEIGKDRKSQVYNDSQSQGINGKTMTKFVVVSKAEDETSHKVAAVGNDPTNTFVSSSSSSCPLDIQVVVVDGTPSKKKQHNVSNASAQTRGSSLVGGVSPRQLKSRLEKLTRLADERRKQYVDWSRNRSRSDMAKSEKNSSSKLTIPFLSAVTKQSVENCSNARDTECVDGSVPAEVEDDVEEQHFFAGQKNDTGRKKDRKSIDDSDNHIAAKSCLPFDNHSANSLPTSSRDSALADCCRMCCIL